jgi:hypothetical protein
MNFGYSFTFQTLDKGLIERLGPSGFTASIFNSSANFVGFYSGFLYHTTFIFLVSTCVALSFFVLGSFGILSVFNVSFASLFIAYFVLGIMDSNKTN